MRHPSITPLITKLGRLSASIVSITSGRILRTVLGTAADRHTLKMPCIGKRHVCLEYELQLLKAVSVVESTRR